STPVTTGTVTFMDGSTVLAANRPLDGSGNATCTVNSLSATGHTITAIYSGASGLGTSTGSDGQTISQLAFTFNIGNASQTYGTPADLAAQLGTTTITTPFNNETLDISYSSTGDTATADVNTYLITGNLSDGTGSASNYSVTLNPGTLTVNPANISYT